MAKSLLNTVTKEVRRTSNAEAEELVRTGQWKYIGKMEGKRLLSAKTDVVSVGKSKAA